MDKVKLYHPVTGGTFTTTQRAFENAWIHKGWELAEGVIQTPDVEPEYDVEDLSPPSYEPPQDY